MSEVWTTLKVLDWTAARFQRAGIKSARLDAQVLLAHVLHCRRVDLYTNFDKPLEEAELAAYRGLLRQRLGGEPVAYLVGHQEFWSLPFDVDNRVLIPRPDTETLVQLALELGDSLSEGPEKLSVADIATGSGAIGISLATERRHWSVVATDISRDALAVARGNAKKNNCENRIDFRHGHLLQPLATEQYSLVVSNLPYIGAADMESLSPEVRREPHSALLGGDVGVELIEDLVGAVGQNLSDGGWVVLEHGYEQAGLVRDIITKAGFSEPVGRADLAGRARVSAFRAM